MERSGFDGHERCCFTGHRPAFLPDGGDETLPGMMRLKLLLVHTVEEAIAAGVTTFYAGGAAGFDTIAAEAVLTWKQWSPETKLFLALPSRTQADAYSEELRMRYERIFANADGAYFASETVNSPAALRARNRYMVDHADCCIAYLKQSAGGTFYTAAYAKKRGLYIRNLANVLPEC